MYSLFEGYAKPAGRDVDLRLREIFIRQSSDRGGWGGCTSELKFSADTQHLVRDYVPSSIGLSPVSRTHVYNIFGSILFLSCKPSSRSHHAPTICHLLVIAISISHLRALIPLPRALPQARTPRQLPRLPGRKFGPERGPVRPGPGRASPD